MEILPSNSRPWRYGDELLTQRRHLVAFKRASAQTNWALSVTMVATLQATADEQGGSVMKAMDEFGSVLAMAALILGVCAAVDGLFVASDGAVAKADDGARVAPAVPMPKVQQARLSW